jgi:hypothetical protein
LQLLANTRRYAKQLQREHLMYRGGVQRLATILSADMPNAVALLDRVLTQLQAYMAASPTLAESTSGVESGIGVGADGGDNMKRAVDPEGDAKDEPAESKPDAASDSDKPQQAE